MESMNKSMAILTVGRYVCSNCWGELETRADPRDYSLSFVVCKRCQDDTKGYVTRHFADRRRGESEFEKLEVTRMLQENGVLPKPEKRTVGQNLKELGF
jgi:hypothetical protein